MFINKSVVVATLLAVVTMGLVVINSSALGDMPTYRYFVAGMSIIVAGGYAVVALRGRGRLFLIVSVLWIVIAAFNFTEATLLIQK